MKKTAQLAAIAAGAALLLTACGGADASDDVPEIDASTPEGTAAAIIVLTAHEQFDEACEHSERQECTRHLQEAHDRWAADEGEPSLLEQAKEVTADDFNTLTSQGRISWSDGPEFAGSGTWSTEFIENDGQYLVDTTDLQNG